VLYRYQGRLAEAEALLKEALGISEKSLGDHHPDVAVALNNLAVVYRHQTRYRDAEPLYRCALAIDESALGPNHPVVAIFLSNLATVLHELGRETEANCEQRAERIRARQSE
jgi:tetratricopeptide (TPR) repeat protein